MADAGYDVWIPNARGNVYSRNHTKLDPNILFSGFWDFSWDDIGTKDFPAVVDYIRNFTKQNSMYMIGDSQGCSSILAFLSLRPEYNQYMKAVSLMGPVSYLSGSGAFLQLLGELESTLEVIIE